MPSKVPALVRSMYTSLVSFVHFFQVSASLCAYPFCGPIHLFFSDTINNWHRSLTFFFRTKLYKIFNFHGFASYECTCVKKRRQKVAEDLENTKEKKQTNKEMNKNKKIFNFSFLSPKNLFRPIDGVFSLAKPL